MAEDQSLERTARLSIREDVERLRRAVSEEHWKPPGIGLFASSARNLFAEVDLATEPRDRVLVDATPWVRPIAAVLGRAYRACVVTLDRGRAVLWEYQLDHIEQVEEIEDRVLRDANFTGGRWGGRENTTHNKVEELAKKHYRHVADRLEQLFFPEDDHAVQYRTQVEGRHPAAGHFDVLVVGEHGDQFGRFRRRAPDRIRDKLAGTFTDPSLDDRGALKEQADQVLDRWERDREKQQVDHVVEIEAMGGFGATGLRKCLWAASSKAIETLLLRNTDETPGVVCDVCGWLRKKGSPAGLRRPAAARARRRGPAAAERAARRRPGPHPRGRRRPRRPHARRAPALPAPTRAGGLTSQAPGRPSAPPVGSQRRPDPRATSTRTTDDGAARTPEHAGRRGGHVSELASSRGDTATSGTRAPRAGEADG